MVNDWGPWKDHFGNGCPLPVGTIAELMYEDCIEISDIKGGLSWYITDPLYIDGVIVMPILAYRVKKPKGLAMLEELIQEVELEKAC